MLKAMYVDIKTKWFKKNNDIQENLFIKPNIFELIEQDNALNPWKAQSIHTWLKNLKCLQINAFE